MKQVNLYEAKTDLSALVEAAAAGEEIIIAKAGKPIAKLTRLDQPETPRRLGILEGKGRASDDFDAPLPPDLLDAFEGR